jgi:hypothetical protein
MKKPMVKAVVLASVLTQLVACTTQPEKAETIAIDKEQIK